MAMVLGSASGMEMAEVLLWQDLPDKGLIKLERRVKITEAVGRERLVLPIHLQLKVEMVRLDLSLSKSFINGIAETDIRCVSRFCE
jgi:hypothetical protein